MAVAVVYVFTILLSIILTWFTLCVRKRQVGEPPLENGWIPFLGVALEFRQNPLEFLRSKQRKYGDSFTCKIAGNFFTFIMDPFSYSAVFRQGKNLDFQTFAIETSRKVFGHADFNDPIYNRNYKEIHALFRQTLQGPALHNLTSSMMENLQTVMLRNKTSEWTTEGLQSFSFRIMFEAGFRTLFGREEKPSEMENIEPKKFQMTTAMDNFNVFDRAFPEIAAGFPIYLLKKAYTAREALTERLQHKYLKKNHGLSALIERRMNLFDQMPYLDELGKARTHTAMLWASQANTLPATFWSLYYMLRSPEALKVAQTEVERVIQESNQKLDKMKKTVVLSKEQLDSMSALGSIIDEALRLSSASIMIRVATENFVLNMDSGKNVSIRKGDRIAMFPQMIHMDPEIYENPTEFKFNRFLDENGQKKTFFYKNQRKLKNFLLPFGSGVSECPGRFFAVNEIKQFLALVVFYYDMELKDPATPVDIDCSRAGLGILPPKHDVLFRYKLKDCISE
uniref:Cytochrome P450, family 7, subfamily B, polypeptide 1 n=1 Tax=Lepisosteus oculatus TaxID=7918 RepID=W5MD74_LEPOC|nr:PREDICTED: cholesterol 7-alpha-monooxygenase-like isoform X1 [Lepisosteus oculatus]